MYMNKCDVLYKCMYLKYIILYILDVHVHYINVCTYKVHYIIVLDVHYINVCT